uniref:Ig-like domain-containing protein n=1 Tax=Castor canadensis TaxID=51338 RepID=A0A8C0WM22_CASCN
ILYLVYSSDWPMTDYVSVSTAHFLEQLKGECHFSNGHVRSVTRYVYNREEFVHFDSDVGEFRAVTELGKPIAKELNSEKDVLDNYRASVDRCRNDYALVDILLLNQRVEPKVTVYPTKTQPLQHHNLMVCSVSGFYPGQIEVRWFQNGQEEEVGVVSTGLIKNGDWTFQILVMLETVPESGEVYTCQVEHPSLKNPVTVEWSEENRCKLLTFNQNWLQRIGIPGEGRVRGKPKIEMIEDNLPPPVGNLAFSLKC